MVVYVQDLRVEGSGEWKRQWKQKEQPPNTWPGTKNSLGFRMNISGGGGLNAWTY